MFKFIFDFIRATFGVLAMFILFLFMCLVGYFLYWFLEYAFVGAVTNEWITNEYVTTAIRWLFECQYSDIIEILLVVGFALSYIINSDD